MSRCLINVNVRCHRPGGPWTLPEMDKTDVAKAVNAAHETFGNLQEDFSSDAP
jgi:hypothetical protein